MQLVESRDKKWEMVTPCLAHQTAVSSLGECVRRSYYCYRLYCWLWCLLLQFELGGTDGDNGHKLHLD
ncbi:hypothetical protein TcYC6_0073330 [Trypanosoma cruzi]|nr:hypothetical protein TcYC6_0073330 [Trypanosoma cruzi]